MSRRKRRPTFKNLPGQGFAAARLIMETIRQPAEMLIEASVLSEELMTRMRTKTGTYRAMRKAEAEQIKWQLEVRRGDLVREIGRLARAVHVFDEDYPGVTRDVAALYAVHAAPVRLWDLRGVSAMEVLYLGAVEVLLWCFGHERSAIGVAKQHFQLTDEVRATLEPKLLPYWPGHYYRKWLSRDMEELGDIEVRLRREHLALTRDDPGPLRSADDDEIPPTSSKGLPMRPTARMSLSQGAKLMGDLDRRTFRGALIDGTFSYRRISSNLYEFDETEKPARKGR